MVKLMRNHLGQRVGFLIWMLVVMGDEMREEYVTDGQVMMVTMVMQQAGRRRDLLASAGRCTTGFRRRGS